MATALLFNISDVNKKRNIRKILSDLKITYKEIPPDNQGQSIGYLAEVEGFERMENPVKTPFQVEMLVLHGFSERKMGRFLQELRTAGSPVALKAVTTHANLSWTCTELYTALSQEHERMKNHLY